MLVEVNRSGQNLLNSLPTLPSLVFSLLQSAGISGQWYNVVGGIRRAAEDDLNNNNAATVKVLLRLQLL